MLATGDEITLRDLPSSVRPFGPPRAQARAWDQPFVQAKETVVAAFEREYVESVMARTGGNLTESARLAGMDRANFRRLARRHDIDLDTFRPV